MAINPATIARVLAGVRNRNGNGYICRCPLSTHGKGGHDHHDRGVLPEALRIRQESATAAPVNGRVPIVPPLLVIERPITTDCASGQPWPPPGDGWRALRSADGRTLWRRITLE
jgi:hypothetical protein